MVHTILELVSVALYYVSKKPMLQKLHGMFLSWLTLGKSKCSQAQTQGLILKLNDV